MTAPASPPQISPDQVGRTSQIIAIALILGVCVFAGVAITIAMGKKPDEQPGSIVVSSVAVLFAVTAAMGSVVTRRRLTSSQVLQNAAAIREDYRRALAPIYSLRNVVSRALLEGAAFFNLIAYIVEGQMWTLGIVAVLVAMMAVPFPSQTDFENWAEQVRRDVSS